MNKKKVVKYLAQLGFELLGDGKDVVTVRTDKSCEMASVDINGEELMLGNYWDFHNGCHGMVELPPFHSYGQLAHIVADALGSTVLADNEWRYTT